MRLLLFECLHWKGFLESSPTVFHIGLIRYFLTVVTEKPCVITLIRGGTKQLGSVKGLDVLMP